MKAFCHIYAQWDQVRENIRDEARHLLNLGLICDTTFGFAQGEKNKKVLRTIADAGGICAPNIYPRDLDPACRNSNWWKYSEAECVRLLGLAQQKYEKLGLGPMRAINTYTTGNSLVAACRKIGVQYILGFCAPTVIEDGGWEIAHYGSPLSPYFISDEDFRKPENPGQRPDSVLMSSMELRNPMVCLNHWSEGPWCPLNAQAADRWLEPTGEPLPFLQIAEDWLRQTELTQQPKFFHINLQYFFAGRCREHNRRALEWLAEQRDKGRLEVGSLQLWRKRLEGNEGFQKQTTYWRGEMMGFHVGHRPGCFPDVVVEEHLQSQTIWQKPELLPRRLYDYEATWDYPAFQPDGSAPKSEDFAAITVRQNGSEIEVDNPREPRLIPLMLWDLLQGLEAPFSVECLTPGWTAETLPHPSGVGGAVKLEGLAQTGKSVIKIAVSGKASTQSFSKSWPGLVEAQTFFHQGRPYTVLAAQTPDPFFVMAEIHRNPDDHESIEVEHLLGISHQKRTLNEPLIALCFDGTRLACWHRLWGVTADQITLHGVKETQARLRKETATLVDRVTPGLKLNEEGYQLFGDIRDTSRWDRTLARAAGNQEKQRINAWLLEQRPDAGTVVIEAHPGLFLPRGSITKVLGHEFDDMECKPGYAFHELCADYPQGWDWGVAAWVQWRHLRVKLEGLRSGKGTYTVHLHACDPERRDLVQQIYFFNPEANAEEICAVREWIVPAGLEGRWSPTALCSVKIPDACLSWPSVGIWIVPLEKSKLYDWVAERGAPGRFSHLWVTWQE